MPHRAGHFVSRGGKREPDAGKRASAVVVLDRQTPDAAYFNQLPLAAAA